jgi:hypothetical protein
VPVRAKFLPVPPILSRNHDLAPMPRCPADISELGSELIKIARSLVIPADPPTIEPSARGVCRQAMHTMLQLAPVRVVARRQRWRWGGCTRLRLSVGHCGNWPLCGASLEQPGLAPIPYASAPPAFANFSLKAGLSPGKIVLEDVRGFHSATHNRMCCFRREKHLSQYQIDGSYIIDLAEDPTEVAAVCLLLSRLIRLVLWLALLVCQRAEVGNRHRTEVTQQ